MASNDDEDDYLSDKFLFASEAAASSSKAQTYSERRKQAQKQSDLKNKQNRTKSRRERELEAREEGLKRSLFERAKEEEEQHGKQNKAMNMLYVKDINSRVCRGSSHQTMSLVHHQTRAGRCVKRPFDRGET